MSDFAASHRPSAALSATTLSATQMKSALAQRLNASPSAVAQAKLAQALSPVQREAVPHDDETLALQQKADPAQRVEDEDMDAI